MHGYARHKMLVSIGVLVLVLLLRDHALASSVTVSAIVSPNCGNDIIDSGETCDGTNLGGATCSSLGAGSGSLSCGSNCLFDTTSCSVPPPTVTPPPANGGAGGSTPAPAPLTTAVIFSGRAYPNSKVTLLKDSNVLATTVAGSDANFQISISGLAGGNYLFSLYSEDSGIRSSLSNFPVMITAGITVQVSGVFITPTLSVSKQEVKLGDSITFAGRSAPKNDVVISLHSTEEILLKTKADANGLYSYTYTTDQLEAGDHAAKSRASLNGEISAYGRSASFKVGTKNVAPKSPTLISSDLDNDSRVSLVDFSIMAYWYKRASPPAHFDLNNDKKVDLVDFSIMAFYWTG
jgi:hypothetical protein